LLEIACRKRLLLLIYTVIAMQTELIGNV
jgi:hypothetical protein